MNKYKILSAFAAVLTISLIPLHDAGAASRTAAKASSKVTPKRTRTVSPFVRRGVRATPVASAAGAGPQYGIFTCQLVGAAADDICYDPYQVRHAYNIDSLVDAGYDGNHRTIVIIDSFQSPNIVAQLNTYNTFYGLPSLNGLGNPSVRGLGKFTQVAPDGLTPFDMTNDDQVGWAEEISLDVTWAHAMAPGANITLVLAKSDQDSDILSATKYAIDNNLGDVISQSFGEAESCMDPALLTQQHALFVEATQKKMTIFASAGDNGAAQPSCDGNTLIKAVSTPASDPLVTGVGGTTLTAAGYCFASVGCDPTKNPAPGTYQGEVAWNEDAAGFGAGGGGFSVLFAQPDFQNNVRPSRKIRGVPDVSYNASVLQGVLTYLDIPGIPAGYYSFGGTSAGSPQWAAVMAIADNLVGEDLGFINTAIYKIANLPNPYAAAFNDVTSGNNSVGAIPTGTIQGFSATKGWDAVTGLGSPSAESFIYWLIPYRNDGDAAAAIADVMPPGQKTGKRYHMRSH